MPGTEEQFHGETIDLAILGWQVWQRSPRRLLGVFVSVSDGMRRNCDCIPLYQWSGLVTTDELEKARQREGFWSASDDLVTAVMRRAGRSTP